MLAGEVSIPGYNPVEAYEAAIANLDPSLTPPRASRASVAELLAAFADEPLATAEIVADHAEREPRCAPSSAASPGRSPRARTSTGAL